MPDFCWTTRTPNHCSVSRAPATSRSPDPVRARSGSWGCHRRPCNRRPTHPSSAGRSRRSCRSPCRRRRRHRWSWDWDRRRHCQSRRTACGAVGRRLVLPRCQHRQAPRAARRPCSCRAISVRRPYRSSRSLHRCSHRAARIRCSGSPQPFHPFVRSAVMIAGAFVVHLPTSDGGAAVPTGRPARNAATARRSASLRAEPCRNICPLVSVTRVL
jgi:hypothetical protein